VEKKKKERKREKEKKTGRTRPIRDDQHAHPGSRNRKQRTFGKDAREKRESQPHRPRKGKPRKKPPKKENNGPISGAHGKKKKQK